MGTSAYATPYSSTSMGLYPAETDIQRYLKLLGALRTERATFEPTWSDVASFTKPRRLRLTPSDTNKGGRRNQNIIDAHATMAAGTLRAGLLTGMTSAARPWFRVGTLDSELAKFGPVRDWLENVRVIMAAALLKSNFYNAAPYVYGDMGTFGTGAVMMMPDARDVFRFTPLPIGEYFIANDDKLRVRTCVRQFRMTVRQLVQQFGKQKGGQFDWSNFSVAVRTAWEQSNRDLWIDVIHVLEENALADARYLASKYKPYRSCYFELGRTGTEPTLPDQFLSEEGFDEFPGFFPRWEVSAGDVYGTEYPGVIAIGATKALQLGEKVAAQALDKMVRPPMLAPTSFRASKISQLPGEVSYGDETPNQMIRPLVDTSAFRVDYLETKQSALREQIDDAYFVTLFRMISSLDAKNVTATAITEMKEEKFLLLGPVLGQSEQDFLKPLIDREFAMLYRAGKIPPAPPELQGQELTVEYTSVMAEAQKALGRQGVDVFSGFAAQIAAIAPAALDKIDTDKLVEHYADMTAIPPDIIRPDDEVAQIRGQRAQASQAAAAAQSADTLNTGAQAAHRLSQTDLSNNDSALAALVNSGGRSISTGVGNVPGGV